MFRLAVASLLISLLTDPATAETGSAVPDEIVVTAPRPQANRLWQNWQAHRARFATLEARYGDAPRRNTRTEKLLVSEPLQPQYRTSAVLQMLAEYDEKPLRVFFDSTP